MLEVLDLYPYFSHQSRENFFHEFYNDVICLVKYDDVYYLISQNEIPLGKIPLYYFGKFTNSAECYEIYRTVFVIIKLLGIIQKVNEKYSSIDINILKNKSDKTIYTDQLCYCPFVDKTLWTTVCITFDNKKFYLQEFCNFRKVLLRTLFESENLSTIKSKFARRKEENFAANFWEVYHYNEANPCLDKC